MDKEKADKIYDTKTLREKESKEMYDEEIAYLTPRLIYILQISLQLGTTNNKEIASYLDCSEQTVKSNFRRIAVLLKSKNRSESLLTAIRLGLIQMNL
jgi:DNA-binding CsgD family transcriptional regulator